jgi:Rad3-related DNA helicase
MQISVTLPYGINALSAVPLLRTAIDQQVMPDGTAPGGRASKLFIPPDLVTEMEASGYSVDSLTVSVLINMAKSLPKRQMAVSSTDQTDTRQRMQDGAVQVLGEAMLRGTIALQEVSTGGGKSRIAARLAETLASVKRDRKKTYIVSPSISVMAHLIEEFAHVNKGMTPGFLLGRQNFVSELRLELELEELSKTAGVDEYKAVQNWLNRGGPPLQHHTQLFARKAPGLCFFVDDLLSLAPDFPVGNCLLIRSDDTDAASRAVDELKAECDLESIVFCTHAMFGLLYTGRFAKQSEETVNLIVDEAHLFEESIAGLLSSELSFASMTRWLEKGPFAGAREAGGDLRRLWGDCSRLFAHGDWINPGHHFRETCERLFGDIKVLMEAAARKKGFKEDEEFLHFRNVIARILADHGRTPAVVTLSPVRSYPSLTYGPRSIHKTLERMWYRIHSACLLSGTLTIPKKNTPASYDHFIRTLAIPSSRVFTRDPVQLKWIYDSPDLVIPQKRYIEELCYPTNEEAKANEHAREKWAKACAKRISWGYDSAAGGFLVLLNSHDDIRLVRSFLSGKYKDALVPDGHSVSSGTSYFRSLFAKGIRPLWLATGPAWTGLDIKDNTAASEDFLLTDLAVLRVPFGTNRTSTAIFRNDWNTQSMMREGILKLRQGFGRLIRREGLPQRRIHFLDGRVFHDPHQSKQWVKWVRMILDQYA